MFRRGFRTLALGFIAVTMVGACGGCGDNASPTESDDSSLEEEATGDIGDFFTEGDVSRGVADAGGDYELPGGGTITIPLGASQANIVVAEAFPTEDGRRAFAEWNGEAELPDSLLKVTVSFDDRTPDYVIVRRPVSDADARIYAAGYIDLETGDPDWAPVPSSYDTAAAEVAAAVGLGLFQPGQPEPQVLELSGLDVMEGTTYVAYVAVAIGGRTLKSEIDLIPVVPVEAFEVEYHGPDVPIAAQIGAQIFHITNKPLDSLTVTSGFGPRPTPTKGASGNHRGVDYRAVSGTPVYAAGTGIVTIARCQLNSVNCGKTTAGGITGGYYVEVDHGDGEATRYFHMTQPANVRVGDAVFAGEQIGLSDATGGVAPHLHFEIRKNGVAVDPELVFQEQLRTTVAMAVDLHKQASTEQQITVTFGRQIEVEDLEDYAASVSLANVAPGEHRLQFVSIQPSGSLEVVAEVPFTVTGGPFAGVSGHWVMHQDTRYTNPTGDYDAEEEIYLVTFSVVAVGENRLEGQGHASYLVNDEFTEAFSLCPITSHIASAEWDVFFEGTFQAMPDGSMSVDLAGTPAYGPDYVSSWNAPGCAEKTHTETIVGQGLPAIGGTLVNGEYYYRDDYELGEGTTGEEYFEELIEVSASE